jgi:hypothetical protein
MEEPKTKVFIFGKDRPLECFQFPLLTDEILRLKKKMIVDVTLKSNFKKEWIEILEKKSTYTGNFTQSITFDDGEVINRIVQVRVDDTHHNKSQIHINIDVHRTGTINKDKISYNNNINNHFTDFNMSRIEDISVGIGYNGETVFQTIAFVSNQEQASHMCKHEELLRKAINKAASETGTKLEEL